VQVGAYPRPTAETIARRLQSKGYPVFVTARSQGLFAVRVGRYSSKAEADEVADRLERQEQFNKPWVTR
jgi:cell division septation protein DedD